jgi:hypothetical protein
LTSVQKLELEEIAAGIAQYNDMGLLQAKIIKNMEKLKEWDRQGWFDRGQIYRVDFNPNMELHLVQQQLFPQEIVMKELLDMQ